MLKDGGRNPPLETSNVLVQISNILLFRSNSVYVMYMQCFGGVYAAIYPLNRYIFSFVEQYNPETETEAFFIRGRRPRTKNAEVEGVYCIRGRKNVSISGVRCCIYHDKVLYI